MTLTIDSIRNFFYREPAAPTTPAVFEPKEAKPLLFGHSFYDKLYAELYADSKPFQTSSSSVVLKQVYQGHGTPSYYGWTSSTLPNKFYADVPPKSDGEIYRDAARYIEEHGWTQGSYKDAGGQVCLVGAIMAVSRAEDAVRAIGYLAWQLGTAPIHWNDMYGRTREEVLALLYQMAWRREPVYNTNKELELTPA